MGSVGRRALVAVLLTTTVLTAGVVLDEKKAFAQAAAQVSFDIPAGPLARTLASFGSQSGTQISYDASLAAGKSSPGIRGAATREQALAQILQGSGLGYSFSDAASVVITSGVAATHGSADAGGALVLDTINVTGGSGGFLADGLRRNVDWLRTVSHRCATGFAADCCGRHLHDRLCRLHNLPAGIET